MQSIIPPGKENLYQQSHYSPAVIDGDRVYLAGVIGVGADGRVSDDPEQQFVDAFEGVKATLEAAGCSLADIAEMTTYHIDLHDHLGMFFEVKDRYILEPYPAWTAIGTTALARRKALVEIRVIASKAG